MIVFARDSDPPGNASTLHTLDVKSGAVRDVFAPGKPVFDLAVSPDATQVAYVTVGRPGDQIRIVGIDGSEDRRLVAGDLVIDDVSWTPDGTRIVYTAGPFDRRGNRQFKRSEIYTVAVEGGEPTAHPRPAHRLRPVRHARRRAHRLLAQRRGGGRGRSPGSTCTRWRSTAAT